MSRSLPIALFAAAVVIMAVSAPTLADLTFSDGATHTISTQLPGESVTISKGTTLNVATGGIVPWGLSAYNSTINVNGGEIDDTYVGSWDRGIDGSNSTVNVNSGIVTGGVGTLSTCAISANVVNVSGGAVYSWTGTAPTCYNETAINAVTVNVTGGTIQAGSSDWVYGIQAGTVSVYSGAVINVTNTPYECPWKYGISTGVANIYGGTITSSPCGYTYAVSASSGGFIQDGNITGTVAVGGGTMNISGGTIAGAGGSNSYWNGVQGNGCLGTIEQRGGTVNITGGSIAGAGGNWNVGYTVIGGVANIYSGATINVKAGIAGFGGGFNDGVAMVGGTVNVCGGSVVVDDSSRASLADALRVAGGVLNIYGGHITFQGPLNGASTGGIEAQGGTINVYGSSFDYPYGPITATSGTLTGTLTDGATINLTFYQQSSGEIILHPAPEPATLSLLILGGVTILRRRK
jgi:hypothetical protein